MSDDVVSVLQVAATLAAMLAGLFALLTVKAVRGQTEAATILQCFHAYIDVRRSRGRAVAEGSVELCKDHFREMLDLCWSEYQLWRMGHIPTRVFRLWMHSRARVFERDAIELGTGAAKKRIAYQDEWKALLASSYWEPTDKFCAFMDMVHNHEIDKAMRSKP